MKGRCEIPPAHRGGWVRGGAAVALAVLALLSACGQEQPVVRLSGLPGSNPEPTLLFEGFRMVSTQGLQPEWDFSARAAQIFEPENMARAQDICIVYYRKGKKVSTLTARRGFIRTDTHDTRAEQQVVMVSEEGVVLRTEKLQWDNRRGRLFTDQPVVIERGRDVLTGVGLEADNELKHIEVLAQVRIRVKSPKDLGNFQLTPVPASGRP